ncbi:MAG: class I SAM-dependent methyltransferase [Rickettsiaceae bacterium]|nr:class I SAM-dependent methyltransferase [Rickettsiaceae bacterium]
MNLFKYWLNFIQLVVWVLVFSNANACYKNQSGFRKMKEVTNEAYVLGTGKKAELRLDILNKVYGPKSQMLLDRIVSNKTNLRILSVGCGTGNVEILLAKRLGDAAKIIAVDISEEQLRIAKNRANSLGLKNIEFIVSDVYNLKNLKLDNCDIVYSRFLLIHLEKPDLAIFNMLNILKPNGILICEEIVHSTMFSYPKNEYVDKAIRLISEIGIKRNLDYDLGYKLIDLLNKQNISKTEINVYQPVFSSGSEKNLLALSLKEGAKNYVNSGLATIKEIEIIYNNINSYAKSTSSIIGMASVFQVVGYKK